MSRVGKHPVVVPDGVEVRLEDKAVTAKGKLGELSYLVTDDVEVSFADGKLTVIPKGTSKRARAMWGTTRARLQSMITGVSQGFTRKLEIKGVGYRAAVQGQTLQLQLGYSHDIRQPIPAGISVKCERPTLIEITGADKQMVGQLAAEVRGYRPPEPYKGKGIKYVGEVILRKEGKKK